MLMLRSTEYNEPDWTMVYLTASPPTQPAGRPWQLGSHWLRSLPSRFITADHQTTLLQLCQLRLVLWIKDYKENPRHPQIFKFF